MHAFSGPNFAELAPVSMNGMGRRKKKMENIPLHTAELADSAGFKMGYLDTDNDWETAAAMEAHRDDHYVFFVQTDGYTEVMLDFEILRLEGLSAGYIRPGQIHHYNGGYSAGYFLAVDPSLLDNHTLTILEYEPASRQAISITKRVPSASMYSIIANSLRSIHAASCSAERTTCIGAGFHRPAGRRTRAAAYAQYQTTEPRRWHPGGIQETGEATFLNGQKRWSICADAEHFHFLPE